MASRPPPPRPPPTPEEEVLRSMEVVEEEIDTRIETMERENSKYLAVLNYLRYINGKKSMEEKEAAEQAKQRAMLERERADARELQSRQVLRKSRSVGTREEREAALKGSGVSSSLQSLSEEEEV